MRRFSRGSMIRRRDIEPGGGTGANRSTLPARRRAVLMMTTRAPSDVMAGLVPATHAARLPVRSANGVRHDGVRTNALQSPWDGRDKPTAVRFRRVASRAPRRRDAVNPLRGSSAALRRLRRDCVSSARHIANHVVLVRDSGLIGRFAHQNDMVANGHCGAKRSRRAKRPRSGCLDGFAR